MIGSFEVTEKAIRQCKLFNLLGQMLYPMRDIEVHLLQVIDYLLDTVRYYLEAIRQTPSDIEQEFIEFFRGIGPMLEQYLTTHKSQECRFLWFCSEYTQLSDSAIEIVMDYLPLTSVIMEYLSQQDDPALFVAAVRLVGNIITSPNVVYVENFFKNGLIESLTIGWQRYGALESVDLAKEITWILSNIVASHSVTMTQAIIDNRYISEKLREMLSLDYNIDFKTRREVLILLRNMVAGYSIDICYRLVYQSNLLAQLVPLMTMDESHL